MKFGFRIPSLTKRIAARTSIKRIIRHNLGFKAPKGLGILTDPEKAIYNKVYNKTSKGCLRYIGLLHWVPKYYGLFCMENADGLIPYSCM